jgi:hypothetical protein
MRSAGWDAWEGGLSGRSHNWTINRKFRREEWETSGGLLNILWTTRKDMILLLKKTHFFTSSFTSFF